MFESLILSKYFTTRCTHSVRVHATHKFGWRIVSRCPKLCGLLLIWPRESYVIVNLTSAVGKDTFFFSIDILSISSSLVAANEKEQTNEWDLIVLFRVIVYEEEDSTNVSVTEVAGCLKGGVPPVALLFGAQNRMTRRAMTSTRRISPPRTRTLAPIFSRRSVTIDLSTEQSNNK